MGLSLIRSPTGCKVDYAPLCQNQIQRNFLLSPCSFSLWSLIILIIKHFSWQWTATPLFSCFMKSNKYFLHVAICSPSFTRNIVYLSHNDTVRASLSQNGIFNKVHAIQTNSQGMLHTQNWNTWLSWSEAIALQPFPVKHNCFS